jgi:hypothetical protein
MDMIFTNMMFNSVSKINTGYMIFDCLYIGVLSFIMFYIFDNNFKNKFFKKVESIVNYFDKTNKLIFSATDKNTSERYRAIMYYISKKTDPSIRVLSEIYDTRYNRETDDYEEVTMVYRIDQHMSFIVDKNIMGRVYNVEKEKSEANNRIVHVEYMYVELYSSIVSLLQLEEWVELRLKEYKEHMIARACDKQLLIEVSYDMKEKEINYEYNSWESNATFDNRFFTNKEMILEKINFFINNPEWYKKRGIPYTLGFLLWGEPGCGKTGFIKALMNMTGRHGITIKLNNRFDMNMLREVMYEEEIATFNIPQNKRIYIFEDIDCMGDIVRKRAEQSSEHSSEHSSHESSDDESSDHNILQKIKKKVDRDDYDVIKDFYKKFNTDDMNNNNLSYFLNILDGLQECPGRIIIMTTNKPEFLDKALIRPGRIDYNINFTKATTEDVKNILEFYWEKKLSMDFSLKIDMKYSHAEVVNFCRISENIKNTIELLEK